MQSSVILLVLLVLHSVSCWGFGDNHDRVLLQDIKALTLHNGKFTTGRRSSPMQQLQCVEGGTAPCSTFSPRVVQCQNRGFDGRDIQWECQTDMDNAFRFGSVEVSCEGYDYPDDPYILYGSCGLKYNLDYSREGQQQKKTHNYYPDDRFSSQTNDKLSGATFGANIIVLIAMALVVYAFYRTCMSSDNITDRAQSRTDQDYPSDGNGGGRGGGGYGWFGRGARPRGPAPSPGFRPEYTADDGSCHNNASATGTGGGAGGFWTGAATGGLLGYMFGNRNQNGYGSGYGTGYGTGYNYGRTPPSYGTWGNSSASRSNNSSSYSSGTRTASGFGGTSRR